MEYLAQLKVSKCLLIPVYQSNTVIRFQFLKRTDTKIVVEIPMWSKLNSTSEFYMILFSKNIDKYTFTLFTSIFSLIDKIFNKFIKNWVYSMEQHSSRIFSLFEHCHKYKLR